MRAVKHISSLAVLSVFIAACGASGTSGKYDAVSAAPAGRDCLRDHTAYYCLGGIRARPHLLAALSEGRDVFELVARLNVQDAVPLLTEILERDRDVRRRMAAARALADLAASGVAESVRRLAADLEEREGVGDAWSQAAAALARLDAAQALTYARDFRDRHPTLDTPLSHLQAHWIVNVVREHGQASDLPRLIEWGAVADDPERPVRYQLTTRVIAARIQLGEEPFASRYRAGLGTPNTSVPAAPELALEGLGTHPNDIPALVRFASSLDPEASIAYDGIDRLVSRLNARQQADLIARLSRHTQMREDPNDTNYTRELQARHHASLARLGHAPSRDRLMQLAGEDVGSTTSVVAAREALRLRLDGAADAAYAVLVANRISREPRVRDALREALLDAAVEHMGGTDARWTAAALDGPLTNRVVYHLARVEVDRSACDGLFSQLAAPQPSVSTDPSGAPVASSADRCGTRIDVGSVRPALLSLTLAGGTCIAHFEQLVAHPRAPREVRGHALEVLGILRAPSAVALAQRYANELPGASAAAIAAATRPD